MSELKASGQLLGRNEDGLWEIETGDAEIHVLNDSARAIWEMCDGETTPEEMAAAVAHLTSLELDHALEQVESALADLQRAQLVAANPQP